MMLLVVTRSLIKVITSVQRAGNGIQMAGVNGYNIPFVYNDFTKHVFTFRSNLVSDGNNIFFISRI